MNNKLVKDAIALLEKFESENLLYSDDIQGFKQWIADNLTQKSALKEPDWEGKENGRSPESAINTLLVHLNRYAKNYSKSAIYGSKFTTQEDFIYLINLKAFGPMTKMELIKKNIQDKPTGMLIIHRLAAQGWIDQVASEKDKRSKVISISDKGRKALDKQMDKIRQATLIVAGDLNFNEKMDLIRLLSKLDHFHQPIFNKNIDTASLLPWVADHYKPSKN